MSQRNPAIRRLPRLTTALERDVLHSLRQYATQTRKPVTALVSEAIGQYLDRQDPAPGHVR